MATPINKRVERATGASFSSRRKPLMVAIVPGDMIEVWEKGTHRSKAEFLSIEGIWWAAIKARLSRQKAEKAAKKKARLGR